jgi:hypothetical protein
VELFECTKFCSTSFTQIFILVAASIDGVFNEYVYHSFLIRSLVDRYLDGFQLQTIANMSAMNICIQVFSVNKYLEQSGPYCICMFTFLRNSQTP